MKPRVEKRRFSRIFENLEVIEEAVQRTPEEQPSVQQAAYDTLLDQISTDLRTAVEIAAFWADPERVIESGIPQSMRIVAAYRCKVKRCGYPWASLSVDIDQPETAWLVLQPNRVGHDPSKDFVGQCPKCGRTLELSADEMSNQRQRGLLYKGATRTFRI